MDVTRELLIALAIVLLPVVPASLYLHAAVARRRRRSTDAEVAAGRAPETPFALLATVGTVLGVAAVVGVLVTIAARLLA